MNFPCFILPSIDLIHLKSHEMNLFRQSCVLHNLILGYYYFTEISTFAEQKKSIFNCYRFVCVLFTRHFFLFPSYLLVLLSIHLYIIRIKGKFKWVIVPRIEHWILELSHNRTQIAMRKFSIHRHKMVRRGQWNFFLTKKNWYAPATLMNHHIRKENEKKETNQSSFDDIKLFIK